MGPAMVAGLPWVCLRVLRIVNGSFRLGFGLGFGFGFPSKLLVYGSWFMLTLFFLRFFFFCFGFIFV